MSSFFMLRGNRIKRHAWMLVSATSTHPFVHNNAVGKSIHINEDIKQTLGGRLNLLNDV